LNNCQLHAILLHITAFHPTEYHNHVEIVNFTGNSDFSFESLSFHSTFTSSHVVSGSISIHSHDSSVSHFVIIESQFIASDRSIVAARSSLVESCCKAISFVICFGSSILVSCADASWAHANAQATAKAVSNFFILLFGNSLKDFLMFFVLCFYFSDIIIYIDIMKNIEKPMKNLHFKKILL
jgi:hypothetical protein